MPRPRLAAALSLLCALLLAPLARAQNEKLTIAEVAPLDSFFVMSIPDWPRAKNALMNSRVGDLWRDPEVKAFVDEFMKETFEDQESDAAELWDWIEKNVDRDDLREPTGAAGFVLFPQPVEGSDDEHEIVLLAAADFGDGAEAMMNTLIDVLERLAKDGRIKLDDDDYDGTEIRTVTIIPSELDNEFLDFDDEDDADDAPKPMHVARAGGFILVSTSRRTLEVAIDRAGGRDPGRGNRLADNRTYTAALTQHPAGAHAHVIGIATDYVRERISGGLSTMLSLFAPTGANAQALTSALGVDAIEAVGAAFMFESEAGIAEQTIGILAPRKAGLLTLVDTRLENFAPPAFAPAEAMSIYSFGFRFDQIPALIRSVVQSLPQEMQGHAAGFQTFVDTQIAPILNALAHEVHFIQSVPRPYEPVEHRPLIAIRLKDALTISSNLNAVAAMMGLTPRDFEGNQIFQSEDDPEAPALGIGFDYLFFGEPVAIENALRLASRPDAARLATSDRFRQAAAALAPGAALYSFSNTAETLEYAYWEMQNADKIYAAQLAQWDFLDEESSKELIDSYREAQPDWVNKLPPLKTVLRHVGDSVGEFRPTPDGYRGRTIFLHP